MVHEGHAQRPQRFVHKQRCSGDDNGLQKRGGNGEGPVSAPDEGVLCPIPVGPGGYQKELRVPGNHRGESRPPDPHGGSAEMAEDEHVIEPQVHKHGGDTGDHGDKGLLALFQSSGIGVGQTKRQQPPEHDGQIVFAVGQDLSGILGGALAGEVEADKAVLPQEENQSRGQRNQGADEELEPEGVADTLIIPAAVELGSEDTRPGGGTENTEIEHKNDLIDDGNTAHGQGTHLAHHNVIQQGYKIGNAVLDDDGNGDLKYPPVKGPVTYVSG